MDARTLVTPKTKLSRQTIFIYINQILTVVRTNNFISQIFAFLHKTQDPFTLFITILLEYIRTVGAERVEV